MPGTITDYRANYAAATTAFYAGFEALFGRQASKLAYQIVAEEIPVNGLTLEAPFLSDGSPVRKWLGDKRFQALRSFRASYPVVPYEKSIRIPALEMRHDASGAIGRKVGQFLASAPSYFDKPVLDLLLENPVGYDDVALLHNSHPHGPAGATQDNLTTDALSHASYRAGLKAMAGWQQENAEPLEMSGTVLLVGTDSEDVALEVAGIDRAQGMTAAGVTDATASLIGVTTIRNVYEGRTTVVVTPRITGAQWFIIDRSKPGLAPIALGVARAPSPIAVDDEASAARFYRDDWEASIEADLAIGAGIWQTIYGSVTA